jgi:hypothetical protein
MLDAHDAIALVYGPQTLPQAPQWFGSFSVEVHEPMQLVCPARHDGTHLPASQTSPAAHALLHIPQCARSLCVLTHAGGVPHTVCPAAHES